MSEPQVMSLTEVAVLLCKRKILIAVVTVLLVALGAVLAFSMRPVYRADVLMMPVASDTGRSGLAGLVSQFGGLGALAGLGGSDTGSAAEYVALIQSQQFVRGFLQDQSLLPVLFADQWDSKKSQWRNSEAGTAPTLEDGYRHFANGVMTVTRERDTGLVTLSIEWTDPQLAAQWGNSIVRVANDQVRARAIAEAKASLDYLRSELNKESVIEVRSAIYKLIENQLNTMMLASGRQQYAFRVVSAASPSDLDHHVRPKRGLMIGLSLFLGILVGSGIAVVLPSRKQN